MAEGNDTRMHDDELSVDELDDVAGGVGDTNNGCNFVAGCGVAVSKPPTS